MENKIKRVIAILFAVCFVMSLTAMTVNAGPTPFPTIASGPGESPELSLGMENENSGGNPDPVNNDGGNGYGANRNGHSNRPYEIRINVSPVIGVVL